MRDCLGSSADGSLPSRMPGSNRPTMLSMWLHGLRRGLHGSERQIRRGTAVPGPMARTSRFTDAAPTARPGSKPRTTHPVHLWLVKCTEAGPGWSPVPARLGLCGTPLRTSLRHACDSFPARFQLVSGSFPARFRLVSSSFPARFQLVSSSVLSSVAFPVGNR